MNLSVGAILLQKKINIILTCNMNLLVGAILLQKINLILSSSLRDFIFLVLNIEVFQIKFS